MILMILQTDGVISEQQVAQALEKTLSELKRPLQKVLLLPPDFTRMYSGAGMITRILYEMLSPGAEVDIMPALGTHVAMTRQEAHAFFGDSVPYEKLIVHNWRTDVEKIGEVPADFVASVSEGLVDSAIDVEVNRRLLDHMI